MRLCTALKVTEERVRTECGLPEEGEPFLACAWEGAGNKCVLVSTRELLVVC